MEAIWGSILANGNFPRAASPLRILWCPKFVSMFVVVSYSLRRRCPMWSQTRYSIWKNLQEVCAQNVVSKVTMQKHVRNVFLICSLYRIIKSCQYGNTMFTKVSASSNASCATIAGFGRVSLRCFLLHQKRDCGLTKWQTGVSVGVISEKNNLEWFLV